MNFNNHLLLAFLFILWWVGLIDVLKHLHKRNKRKKEWAIFIAMVLGNAIVAFLWVAFFLSPKSLEVFAEGIEGIQAQPLLFLAFIFVCLAGIWVVSWNLINDWIRFRFCATVIFLTALLVIIFSNPPIDSNWRIWTATILLSLLGLELFLQILTIPGWLPSLAVFEAGMYHPYGRVYQTKEGFTNGVMNRYGLHQSDKKLNSDQGVRRIVLIGGSFIQGFQVSKNKHLSQRLDELINDGSDRPVQIFSLGMPDAGIGIYMHEPFMDIIIDKFKPDEIIFFLHSSSDFQCETCSIKDQFLYSIEDGVAKIRPEDEGVRHALQHIVIRGYHDTWDPLRTIRTHLLLPKLLYVLVTGKSKAYCSEPEGTDDPISTLIARIIRKITGRREYYQDLIVVSSMNAAGIRNFLFEKEIRDDAKKSFAITKSLYEQISEYLVSKNIKMRVITIPALSHDFFNQDERDWSSIVGEYDLLYPEQDFQDFAKKEGIEFLGMFAQYQKDQLTLPQIKSFYFEDGLGHFTPEGHRYFAESINAAFYVSKSIVSKATTE